ELPLPELQVPLPFRSKLVPAADLSAVHSARFIRSVAPREFASPRSSCSGTNHVRPHDAARAFVDGHTLRRPPQGLSASNRGELALRACARPGRRASARRRLLWARRCCLAQTPGPRSGEQQPAGTGGALVRAF